MLAIVFPSSSDGDATAMVEGLNADVREHVPGLIDATVNSLPGTADPAWVYQAFPGEINDINVYGGMLDSFLFLNDTDSVPIYRILPAVSKDVYGVEYSSQYDLSIEFALTVEAVVEVFAEAKSAPASWFEAGVHAGASVGFGVTAAFSPGWTWGQMFSPLDQMFDMADARAVLPNYAAYQDLIPQLEHFRSRVPDQVDDNQYMENSLDSDWIVLSMEDGPDNVDLSSLTGMSAIVHAGTGNDTLATGGTRPLLDVLGFPYVGNDPPSTVEMYGEEGDDTFHMNKWFDVQDWVVDGGPGNDRLLFTGTESDDIIVLVAGPNGTLEKVILKAPSPNPGQTANEVMKIQYPAGMNPTGGSFRLTFDNDVDSASTTGPVPYNATAAQVQTALNALPSIQGAGGSVSVERLPTGPWTRDSYWMVEFQGGLGNTDLRTMVADGEPLGFELQWTPDEVSVEETVQGYSQSVYRVTLPDNCVGG
ncbi:MAG: hypothetical protein HQ582_25020, partial [Planctomycetes bacterium]|nr:hypothetical protein [Planctomycetota bacterium]